MSLVTNHSKAFPQIHANTNASARTDDDTPLSNQLKELNLTLVKTLGGRVSSDSTSNDYTSSLVWLKYTSLQSVKLDILSKINAVFERTFSNFDTQLQDLNVHQKKVCHEALKNVAVLLDDANKDTGSSSISRLKAAYVVDQKDPLEIKNQEEYAKFEKFCTILRDKKNATAVEEVSLAGKQQSLTLENPTAGQAIAPAQQRTAKDHTLLRINDQDKQIKILKYYEEWKIHNDKTTAPHVTSPATHISLSQQERGLIEDPSFSAFRKAVIKAVSVVIALRGQLMQRMLPAKDDKNNDISKRYEVRCDVERVIKWDEDHRCRDAIRCADAALMLSMMALDHTFFSSDLKNADSRKKAEDAYLCMVMDIYIDIEGNRIGFYPWTPKIGVTLAEHFKRQSFTNNPVDAFICRVERVGLNEIAGLSETNKFLDISTAYGKPASTVQYELRSFVTVEGGNYIPHLKQQGSWKNADGRKLEDHEVNAALSKAHVIFYQRKDLASSMTLPNRLEALQMEVDHFYDQLKWTDSQSILNDISIKIRSSKVDPTAYAVNYSAWNLNEKSKEEALDLAHRWMVLTAEIDKLIEERKTDDKPIELTQKVESGQTPWHLIMQSNSIRNTLKTIFGNELMKILIKSKEQPPDVFTAQVLSDRLRNKDPFMVYAYILFHDTKDMWRSIRRNLNIYTKYPDLMYQIGMDILVSLNSRLYNAKTNEQRSVATPPLTQIKEMIEQYVTHFNTTYPDTASTALIGTLVKTFWNSSDGLYQKIQRIKADSPDRLAAETSTFKEFANNLKTLMTQVEQSSAETILNNQELMKGLRNQLTGSEGIYHNAFFRSLNKTDTDIDKALNFFADVCNNIIFWSDPKAAMYTEEINKISTELRRNLSELKVKDLPYFFGYHLIDLLKRNDFESAALLLQAGLPINITDTHDRDLVHVSILEQNLRKCQFLLEVKDKSGANLYPKNSTMSSAASHAFYEHNPDIPVDADEITSLLEKCIQA